jgi:tRNA (mo5U34)-methyltransferase
MRVSATLPIAARRTPTEQVPLRSRAVTRGLDEPPDLRAEAERYAWYHSIDLGDGVVTQGMFDHRPVLDHYPIPKDLTGKRCLDVATMDGYWAFEMERRGASSVTAIDLDDPEELDWPASLRAGHDRTLDETKAERFALAKRALGSSVERVTLSAYDLGPDLGRFDFVFCGDLLLHLKDPITPVERIRSVCTGSAVIVNVIKRFRFRERVPLAELDGIDTFTWWTTNLEGLIRIVRAAGFARVEAVEPFELPYAGGGEWRGLRGAVHAFV